MTCTVPLTYTPGGAPCSCVWPIEVRLGLSVSLYVFFPLVSELAREVATGLSLNLSQVRIMGANAAVQQPEKTMVLINLVPLRENFDNDTAFMIYRKFWKKQVYIKTSLFGASKVVHVSYPGDVLIHDTNCSLHHFISITVNTSYEKKIIFGCVTLGKQRCQLCLGGKKLMLKLHIMKFNLN